MLRVLTVALGSTESGGCPANSSFSYPEHYYVFAILCWCLKPCNLSAHGHQRGGEVWGLTFGFGFFPEDNFAAGFVVTVFTSS